jgi:hypothetical protein
MVRPKVRGARCEVRSAAVRRRLWAVLLSSFLLIAASAIPLAAEPPQDTPSETEISANMQRMLRERGNRHVTVKVFEKANHPLMDARTGGNAEIPSLKRQVPGLFDTFRQWILKQI